ncbi:MAG: hypothetical protein JSS89_05310 [Bacteroidetes bacterium]|nr:hypothetical protein [Bacteroidota bacterium]
MAALFIMLPVLLQMSLFADLTAEERGAIGDYVGGITSVIGSIATLIALLIIWQSERQDDREQRFMDTFMKLLEQYRAEIEWLRTQNGKPEGELFQVFVDQMRSHLRSVDTIDQVREIMRKQVYDDYSDLLQSWLLAVNRTVMYVMESSVDHESKKAAMKLFRASLGRGESRALYLVLFSKEEGSQTASFLLQHKAFMFSHLDACETTAAVHHLLKTE